MRAWASNAPDLRKIILDNDLNSIPSQKVLGITWRAELDKLKLSFYEDLRPNEQTTKRKILSR